ncbi:multicopper oxidase domain-containing protein, partial [Gracilimonas sediminicola]
MKRKQFLHRVGLGTGALALSPWLTSCLTFSDDELQGSFRNRLPFPGQITDPSFNLSASSAEIEIPESLSLAAFQFNNSVPGPTIRHVKGQELNIQFTNNIGQESIIHWHGLIVPPEMDGHPKDA